VKIAALLLSTAVGWGQSPLRLEKTVPLPGVEGRFDHFALDPKAGRLFVAALGNNTVEVIDIAAGKRLRSIGGMHEPQGIVFVPELHRIYVANGKDGKLHIIDTATFQSAGQVEMGEDADNVRYDAGRKTVWVGYGDGALGALQTVASKRAGDIHLDAHPESFQLESPGPRIFVNVPGAGEIEVIDRDRQAVAAKWAVQGAAANFPMALDQARHRLFAGCRKPAKVLVFDIDTGKVVAEFPCPGDTDDLFYDSARQRLYVAGGEGFIEAFAQKSSNEYVSLGRTPTAAGARTGFYSPELSRFFLAVPHRGNQGAEIRIYSVQ
jgi:DNA-binding beta-propeller fold protein YncE